MADRDDPTLLQVIDFDDPEQLKTIVRSLMSRIDKLEATTADQQEQIDKLDQFQKPMRWVFNKVAIGVGLAIVGSILAWLGFG